MLQFVSGVSSSACSCIGTAASDVKRFGPDYGSSCAPWNSMPDSRVQVLTKPNVIMGIGEYVRVDRHVKHIR